MWPTVLAAIGERKPLLKAQHVAYVAPRPVPELGGAEHTFWLLQADPRVVLVVAFAGSKRGKNDKLVGAVMQALSAGLHNEKLLEGSLRTKTWAGGLLGPLGR